MKFDNASKVALVIQNMKDADLPRSENRANINRLFNGEPSYTDLEAEQNGIANNINFLEAANIAHNARQQFNNAFLKPGNFFTISCPEAPIEHRITWGRILTKNLNRIMKRSLPYVECQRSRFANVVLHGVGPVIWEDDQRWCPTPLAIEELLIPSKTRVSMENLSYFAVLREYTPGKLYRMTHGKKVHPGWNMAKVKEVLANIKDNDADANTTLQESPEQMAERYKSNLGYYESDAVPTIRAWDFYFQDEEDESGTGWYRRIILDEDLGTDKNSKFLFNGRKKKYAKDLSNILHFQFGDGANVAPFRYHSLRSLGFMLYAVCRLNNRLRCKFADAVFESLLQYFRVSNPDDMDRLQKVDLQNWGIIPDGLGMVANNERHQVDADLVIAAMSQNRQNMAENSATFVQDVDSGTEKPMTATEIMARVNSGNALVSGMLTLSYLYQTFEDIEICRRFCIKKSKDPEVVKFQEQCKKDGIPEEWLDHEKWEVQPERVLGSGNKVLALAQADKLMAVLNRLDPDAQRQVIHIFIEENTEDPDLAEILMPLNKKPVSDAVHLAQDDSATLFLGLPKVLRQGINHIDYTEALLAAMQAIIQRIEQRGGMASPVEIIGLKNIAETIVAHIQIIGQEDSEKQRVKQYQDVLTKMLNMVRAYEQRLAEKQKQAQQANGNLPPEAVAKIRAEEIKAASNAKIKESANIQKERHKEISFRQEQERKNRKFESDLEQGARKTDAEIATDDLHTEAEILRQNRQAENEPTTTE
jgi:hypothetical protein